MGLACFIFRFLRRPQIQGRLHGIHGSLVFGCSRQIPFWVDVPVAVIAMDFMIWLQHVMVPAVPVLWRLHRVHHADPDYDRTTGVRFHSIEIVLAMLIKIATIAVLGPSVLAVVIFEVLLNAAAMLNHGNIRLPAGLDRVLRWVIVTPDMHRVHHSVEEDETNPNFGFNLPWWDRLFGTYRAQPRTGQVGMTIGLHDHTDPREVARPDGMLLMPFRGEVEGYAINRRTWSEKQNPDDCATLQPCKSATRLLSQETKPFQRVGSAEHRSGNP